GAPRHGGRGRGRQGPRPCSPGHLDHPLHGDPRPRLGRAARFPLPHRGHRDLPRCHQGKCMTNHTAHASTEAPNKKTVILIFVGLMVSMLMASLGQTVLSTALPTIVGELGGVDQMTWVITGYI